MEKNQLLDCLKSQLAKVSFLWEPLGNIEFEGQIKMLTHLTVLIIKDIA